MGQLLARQRPHRALKFQVFRPLQDARGEQPRDQRSASHDDDLQSEPKQRRWTLHNIIEILKSQRRETISLCGTTFEQITEPSADQARLLTLLQTPPQPPETRRHRKCSRSREMKNRLQGRWNMGKSIVEAKNVRHEEFIGSGYPHAVLQPLDKDREFFRFTVVGPAC